MSPTLQKGNLFKIVLKGHRPVLIFCPVVHSSSWLAIVMGADGSGDFQMTKTARIAFTLVALLGLAPALSACHTTAGVGQDLSQGGHALTNSANANAPHNPNP